MPFLFLMIRLPPRSTLFPYTTLCRSDCTTDTPAHQKVTTTLLDLGLHTMCEKPLALTIRSCDVIIAAAERNGRILDRKSTRLNSSHANISYAVFCLKKNNAERNRTQI